MGQLPRGSIYLIETKFDAKALKVESFKKPLAYITQTTLSVDDTAEIIEILKKSFQKLRVQLKKIFVTQLLIGKLLLKKLHQNVICFLLWEVETHLTLLD